MRCCSIGQGKDATGRRLDDADGHGADNRIGAVEHGMHHSLGRVTNSEPLAFSVPTATGSGAPPDAPKETDHCAAWINIPSRCYSRSAF
jgi:hypothetical protein